MKWFKIDKDFIKRAVFAVTILFVAWLMFSCSGCSTADVPVVEEVAVVEPTPVVVPAPVEVIEEVVEPAPVEVKVEAVHPIEEILEAPIEPVVTPSDTTQLLQ
jgi:hypothetical protein